MDGLAVRRTAGPRRHANSPHPSSREGHHSTAPLEFEVSFGPDVTRVAEALRFLALENDTSLQALAIEAFNDLLKKYGKRAPVKNPRFE